MGEICIGARLEECVTILSSSLVYLYIKRTILTEGEREGDGEGEHDESRGEDEHEEHGADA